MVGLPHLHKGSTFSADKGEAQRSMECSSLNMEISVGVGGGAGLGVFTPSTNRLCSIQTALCILVNTKPTTWSIWAQDTRNFGCLDGFFVLLALPPPVISSDALNLPWQFWKMAKRDEARTPAPVISFLLQPLGRLLSTTWKHKTPSSCLMISSGRFFSLFTFSTP